MFITGKGVSQFHGATDAVVIEIETIDVFKNMVLNIFPNNIVRATFQSVDYKQVSFPLLMFHSQTIK